jgi:hypothetical protein
MRPGPLLGRQPSPRPESPTTTAASAASSLLQSKGAASNSLLPCCSCSSPAGSYFLGFRFDLIPPPPPAEEEEDSQHWRVHLGRCWPPGIPRRASTRTTALLRRHMTSRSASAIYARFAGNRSPDASPASPTSTPMRPAPCASM